MTAEFDRNRLENARTDESAHGRFNGGSGESDRGASVASKPKVAGSNPAGATIKPMVFFAKEN